MAHPVTDIDAWYDDPRDTLIIAEVGSTHDGDFTRAKASIDMVADTGADMVKFQTHIAEAETLRDAPMPSYFTGEPRFEYFKRTAFTEDQWRELKTHAESRGLIFMSSSFSIAATDLLERLDVAVHKIPSGEVTNTPYLEHMATTGKVIIMSSGMSPQEDIDDAVGVFKEAGARLIVLQCTTEYPVQPERVGLNMLRELADRYGLPVGFSDHSMTNYAAFASIMLGACVIEKHITHSREAYGSDAKHSLLPEEFADLVRGVRLLGEVRANPVDKRDASRYAEMRDVFQKSVVTARPVVKGSVLTADDLTTKKPGSGIAPKRLKTVIGMRAARDLPADHLLAHDDLI